MQVLPYFLTPSYWAARLSGDARSASSRDTSIVCVGMQSSREYGPCAGAGLDCDRMAGLLGGYGRVVRLRDGAATVRDVSSALSAACGGKLCIFYYSGHGGRCRDRKGQGGWSEYLCLDNGPLRDYAIWDIVSKAAGRVAMIFDCCHSATMYRSMGGGGVPGRGGFRFSMLEGIPRASGGEAGPDILVWAGCPEDSYSYGGDSGGVLTNAILSSHGRFRTYGEVWRRVARKARGQNPSRTSLGHGFAGAVFR